MLVSASARLTLLLAPCFSFIKAAESGVAVDETAAEAAAAGATENAFSADAGQRAADDVRSASDPPSAGAPARAPVVTPKPVIALSRRRNGPREPAATLAPPSAALTPAAPGRGQHVTEALALPCLVAPGLC